MAWSSPCDLLAYIRFTGDFEQSKKSLFLCLRALLRLWVILFCPPVSHRIPTMTQEKPLLSESNFIAGFHAIGQERYHHKHPFHILMHEGALSRGQLQAWALNRYYYQASIPRKDAALLARSDDHAFRTAWRKRLVDHDGDGPDSGPGGIEKWLKLVEATGLSRVRAVHGDGILPATRYAVDAYIQFVSTRSHIEAVA